MANTDLSETTTQFGDGDYNVLEQINSKEIKTNTISDSNKYTCHCGKSYGLFKNYKSHYVKYKCQAQLIVNSKSDMVVESTNDDLDILDVGYNPILKSRRQLISHLSTPISNNQYLATSDETTTARTPIPTVGPIAVAEVLADNKFAECANCRLRLLKKNMRRHQSNNCKTSRELQLKQQLEAARNILSEYNNILVNNGIIGSNNVINDNRQIINVAINCITKEGKDHLTEEAKVEIVGRIFTAFDCLLDHIYKDDRNKNIYYLGNGKKEVKYISENGEVNVGDADNIIGNIAMSHLNYLDELIDTHRDAVPKPYQKTIDQLINFHSTEDCNPGYIKKTGQKIMSFREYAKAQVKKYEQDYIDKHSRANNNTTGHTANNNINCSVGGLITSK
jgi:hypothetical protein